MHLAPPPNSRDLLPPLLACLPTAFISPRPPPALLPLLAPVLRQRVSYLSPGTPQIRDGWLPLLSWDHERAAKLPAVVERMQVEAHPVSGELELDDIRPAKYRRLDHETMHARLEVEQFDLLPVYLWCETDEHGGMGPGWRLAELRSLEDIDDGTPWFDTPSEASDAYNTTSISVPQTNGTSSYQEEQKEEEEDDDDANDDYWAQYDHTPGRTPAQKRSPVPHSNHTLHMTTAGPSQAELQYFARYGTEVQPALDSHDPDEAHAEIGKSTLGGDALLRPQEEQTQESQQSQQQPPPPPPQPNHGRSFLHPLDTTQPKDPHDSAIATATALDPSARRSSGLTMPRPVSPTSSHSSVDKLEEQAAAMSSPHQQQHGDERAQRGVKQHISTDIKSLFRLAKSAGMERREFERIVRTELEVLDLLERDE